MICEILRLVSLHSNLADEIFGTHLEPQIGDDLNLWSSLYGIDAPPQCPVFEV
jgi:hypothetical protein